MKIKLFSDETIQLNLDAIVSNLSRIAPSSTWVKGKSPFTIKGNFVEFPETYEKLSAKLRGEIKNEDHAILFTEKPYDTNYFWDSGDDKAIIVSLHGWDHLTSLPRNNGAVYFVAALLVRALGIGQSHTAKNTGCINDYWRDKTGVDFGMRSAFICAKCNPIKVKSGTGGVNTFINEVQNILDDLSTASRAEEDISDLWARHDLTESFDVFLCHNSEDKSSVRALNTELKQLGIRTWFDEEQLPPGRAWQELLETQIKEIGSVAIFVGESGTGPWQDLEMRAFLNEFVRRRCAVIPVILGDCKAVPQLPLFISQLTWVDFRKDTPPPVDQLLWGITGKKPTKKEQSIPLRKKIR